MQPLKGIFHNKLYTITGYTLEQINCDDNGANEYPTSVKKDYLVEIKGNMFKSSVAHKERNKYTHQMTGHMTVI